MKNKETAWFDDQCRLAFDHEQRLIFGGPMLSLGLTWKSLSAVN